MTDSNPERDGPKPDGPAADQTHAAQRAAADSLALAAEANPAEDMEQLRQDLAQATDRMLRAQADLENYRKRAQRDLDEERRFGGLGLLRDLLPVLDNVHRAIDAAEKSPESAALLDGVRLVAQQLEGVLKRHHCTRIEALHQPFDPHLHSAVSQQPSAEFAPGTVVNVLQDGYRVHDRVLRPAHVVISAAAPPPEESSNQE